jgi:hypothetical protein
VKPGRTLPITVRSAVPKDRLLFNSIAVSLWVGETYLGEAVIRADEFDAALRSLVEEYLHD